MRNTLEPGAEVITQARHGGKTWRAPQGFHFANDEYLVKLTDAEIITFADHLPFAFQFTENSWQALGMIGNPHTGNACVTSDGQWQSGYIPAILRGYPFDITADQQAMLAIRENSGLVLDNYEGQPFFDASGNLSPLLTKTRAFLVKVQEGRRKLSAAIRELDRHGLLAPWESFSAQLSLPGTGPDLLRVDEKRFRELPDRDYLRLRRANAITLIYAQLYSQRRLPNLTRLTQLRHNHESNTDARYSDAMQGGTSAENELIALISKEMRDLK
ncbi:SapC protein [Marinobacter sp. DSM 26671]|jgi:hypothetical protein|uniref:SapC family protein n=1 Tax=Marinobacter sp. DSM 26671 TaxID=1761793 RepID=UPI0008E9BD38|nr:SapC family protein [Marinobacter sp. DSM 26671]SFD95660.1 SapC protein [Marinobacter sp. DSM 26671]